MTLTLHSLHSNIGSKKLKKRIGRGLGSKGTYSGRGVKGQSARSGVSGLKLQGLRHIMLATPKMRGFSSGKKKAQVVNVEVLSCSFQPGSKITPKLLASKGLITDAKAPVKILGKGAISISLTITDCLVSASAKEKIEGAGGTVIISS